jgi:Raf kinase inhibitor-like YbhB/YbcL family protein
MRIALFAGLALGFACASPATLAKEEKFMNMTVTSPAFEPGQPIPRKHSGEGEDVSPPLKWNEPPPGTKSLALISDDPDAPMGTWVHWVVYGLPPTLRELPENAARTEDSLKGGKQGLNDFRRTGYGGPMPPPGKPHRYFFKLYALDTDVPLKPGARKADLLKSMTGHILAEGQLMGTYQRK